MFDLLYNFLGFNQKLFLLINHLTNSNIIPYILQIFSWPFAISNFALCYIILCIYLYIRIRTIRDVVKQQYEFWHRYYNLVNIGIIYACFGLIYAALKFSINLPRPFCSLLPSSFITIIDTTNERCLSGFPSAHTGLAILISYFVWPYLNYIQKTIACLIVLLVGISRITLAMHYPADIIYSILIASLVIIIGNLIFKMFTNNLIQIIGKIIYKRFFCCYKIKQ